MVHERRSGVNLSDLKVPADQRGPANGYDESVAGTVPWKEKWARANTTKTAPAPTSGAGLPLPVRDGKRVCVVAFPSKVTYGKAEASGDPLRQCRGQRRCKRQSHEHGCGSRWQASAAPASACVLIQT